MPDNKRTRQMRASKPPDVGLEDTMAPTDAAMALDETIAETPTPTPPPDTGGRGRNPDDADPSLERGASVGRYVVLDLLGKGGMGEVYTAYDPELDRRIALKVIHAAVRAGGDPSSARASLLREAQTLAKLSHPNVVAVYDVGTVDSGPSAGDVYVAMEFIEGSHLRHWLAAEERSLADILEVFTAAASGLAAAHDEGLVHRDVKPDNILIGDDGRVRVIDFGIAQKKVATRDDDELVAKLAKNASLEQSQNSGGSLVGTPAYMTPEQFLGGSAGGRSDQFSLCVALFEAVSGERPFAGKTLPELSTNVLENKRRELTVGPQVPSWLATALEKGLSPDPEDRHEDMRALASALVPPEPRRLLRTWMIAAAAVVGIGGIGAAYALGGAKAAAETCDNAADPIREVWNDDAKSNLETAFAAANAAHGNEAFVRTRDVLDGYVKRWSGARVEACRESVKRQLPEMTSAKKLACLEGGLRELRAVVTVLSTADAELIEEAVNTASSITPVDRCSNLTRLIAAPTVPVEIDEALATVKTLERAGRYKQGAAAVNAALERAEALGSAVGKARALVWRGRLESQNGKVPEAVESLFAAVRAAEEAGDTYAQAQAWTYLVFVVGTRQRERLAALRWSKHAEVAIKQDGTPLDLESRRLYHEALAKRGLRRYEEALTEFRRAAEFSEQAFGAGSFEVLLAKMGEAMTMRSLTRREEAVAIYKQVIDGMTDLLGRDNPKLAASHSNLGVVLVELRQYEEGRENYERALELKRRKLGDEHRSVLITRMNMAVLEERLGNFEAADKAIVAIHETRKRLFGDNYAQLPSTLVNRAWLSIKRGDLKLAEALARRSLDRYLARGADARESAAWAEVTLCNILRLAKRLSEARRHCANAVDTLRTDAEDIRSLASGLSYAAHVELDAGKPRAAFEFAQEAADIRRKHLSTESNQAHTTYILARAVHALGDQPKRALELATMAEKMVANIHIGDRVLIEDDLKALLARVRPSEATP